LFLQMPTLASNRGSTVDVVNKSCRAGRYEQRGINKTVQDDLLVEMKVLGEVEHEMMGKLKDEGSVGGVSESLSEELGESKVRRSDCRLE
jgi:hypothetical protein